MATAPADARSFAPDPAASEIYDRVYAIYRSLYGLLGSSQPELLHELKRIASDTSRAFATT